MRDKKKSKIIITIGVFLILAVLIVWQVSWFGTWQNSSLIMPGVKIGGIAVGKMSIAEAKDLLEKSLLRVLEGEEVEVEFETVHSQAVL